MKTFAQLLFSMFVLVLFVINPALSADKPNIILIVSDDTGYGDLGPYGGGEGRGMPTPNFLETC